MWWELSYLNSLRVEGPALWIRCRWPWRFQIQVGPISHSCGLLTPTKSVILVIYWWFSNQYSNSQHSTCQSAEDSLLGLFRSTSNRFRNDLLCVGWDVKPYSLLGGFNSYIWLPVEVDNDDNHFPNWTLTVWIVTYFGLYRLLSGLIIYSYCSISFSGIDSECLFAVTVVDM